MVDLMVHGGLLRRPWLARDSHVADEERLNPQLEAPVKQSVKPSLRCLLHAVTQAVERQKVVRSTALNRQLAVYSPESYFSHSELVTMGSEVLGLVSVLMAVLLFGSFAVPVRWSRTGDGIFFQWMMCSAIFFVGIIIHFVQCAVGRNAGIDSIEHTCPQFEPLAALGGAIWCISNLLLVPLMDVLGVGLTMFLWGMWESNAGWLPTRFGLFGLNQEAVSSPGLNYAGAGMILLSLLVLTGVQPNVEAAAAGSEAGGEAKPSAATHPGVGSINAPGPGAALAPSESHAAANDYTQSSSAPPAAQDGLRRRLLQDAVAEDVEAGDVAPPRGDDAVDAAVTLNRSGATPHGPHVQAIGQAQEGPQEGREVKWTDRLTPLQRKVFGAAACAVAGCLSGSTFTPVQYIVDHTSNYAASGSPASAAPFPGASTALVDHLHAHFTGIWLTSTAVLLLYLGVTRNRPQVHVEAIPAYLLAGGIWGVAMLFWFLGNANLSIVVSFPLVTLGPGIVSMLWGVLVWREVQGARNYALLAAATAVYVGGAVCIVLSKQ
jgi:hypothetical protein